MEDSKMESIGFWRKKDCHGGVLEAFEAAGIRYYGASRYDVRDLPPKPGYLYIDVGSEIINHLPVVSPDLPRNKAKLPSFLRIYIPDMSIPEWTKKDWADLLEDIQELRKTVIVSCFGGHGRTGLTLSILAALSGACPSPLDPVQFIRDRYCQSVVESESQLDYIAEITGREILCTAAKSFGRFTDGYTIYDGKDDIITKESYWPKKQD